MQEQTYKGYFARHHLLSVHQLTFDHGYEHCIHQSIRQELRTNVTLKHKNNRRQHKQNNRLPLVRFIRCFRQWLLGGSTIPKGNDSINVTLHEHYAAVHMLQNGAYIINEEPLCNLNCLYEDRWSRRRFVQC